MERRLNLLVIVKKFTETMPKHQHKYDMIKAIEQVANVQYWHEDGDILQILEQLEVKPDFIYHYDIEWFNAFAPKISNLNKVNILKGCYVLDVHYAVVTRTTYFRNAKPDLIFSASKYPFLKAYPDYHSRFRWLPFGINPDIIRDYGLEKDIPYSLMGLINKQYPFREAVLRTMNQAEGFVNFKHPGHTTSYQPGMFINDNYAQAINRSKLSFTCGSVLEIPVAKFFELPGCRTLMLAESNADIEELGFTDGEHFLACDRNDFYEKALYYIERDSERERITDNGYRFVQSHHTNLERAKQFVAAIQAEL